MELVSTIKKKTVSAQLMTQIHVKTMIHWQFHTMLWLSNVQFSYSI